MVIIHNIALLLGVRGIAVHNNLVLLHYTRHGFEAIISRMIFIPVAPVMSLITLDFFGNSLQREECEETRSAEPECTRQYMRIRAPYQMGTSTKRFEFFEKAELFSSTSIDYIVFAGVSKAAS